MTEERRSELAQSLAELRQRIERACDRAGRDCAEVTLVAVTKTWPASDVRHLAALGIREVGENRDQEAAPKHDACADLDLRWHFVGALQRNKCRSVARYVDVVQSVDRVALVAALAAAAAAAGRTVGVCLQVSLDGPGHDGRSGVDPAGVADLARRVVDTDGLRLAGVMAVAPRGADPAPGFTRLREISADLAATYPGATMISAGMSGDLEAAVAAGATHLRVGTALLGARSTPVG